jgi:peroxiredoxin Q/BCP
MGEFEKRDTAVLGVSTGGLESHRRFAANNELNYPLLVDEDGAVAISYGVLRRVGHIAVRSTFLIDREGVIRAVWPHVNITGHTSEILKKIDELGLA